ncbi:MAG: histidine kinase dimerization/phosphoacceptor domain -containing protein, partial [Bacteroidota bacterium]
VLKHKLEDLFGLSTNYSTLGEIYFEMGEADSAIFYNQQAIKVKEQIEDKRGIATIQLQLGKIYLEKKAFREAASYLLPSYQLAGSIGEQQLRSLAGVQLAKLRQQEGNDMAVNRYLSEALQYAEGAGARELLVEVFEGYYQYYRAKGDFRAFAYQDRYQALSESLRNDSIVQAFTRNELEYEFESEKRQIALEQAQQEAELQQKIERQQLIGIFGALGALALGIILLLLWRSHRLQQRSNQQLNAQNQTIQKSLEEREILLQEIHHRVKNNLQVISSLLGLQSRSIEDPNALEAISESRNRVRSMALIHQNLYQDAQLTSVSLPGYIEQLSKSLLDSYQIQEGQIKLQQRVDDIALDVDILIPLGLILNELISNALKHAFGERQSGQIDISIVEEPEGIRVEIADNGVGLPADFEQQSSQSLGYKLIRAFVRKMNASLDINGQGGTQVALHIPQLQITS